MIPQAAKNGGRTGWHRAPALPAGVPCLLGAPSGAPGWASVGEGAPTSWDRRSLAQSLLGGGANIQPHGDSAMIVTFCHHHCSLKDDSGGLERALLGTPRPLLLSLPISKGFPGHQ